MEFLSQGASGVMIIRLGLRGRIRTVVMISFSGFAVTVPDFLDDGMGCLGDIILISYFLEK